MILNRKYYYVHDEIFLSTMYSDISDIQMAHNLRSRCVAKQLLENDCKIEVIDLPSSGEEDNLSEDSEEDEYEPFGIDSTESASEKDDYLENSSLEQRLLDLRARQGGRGLPAFRGRVEGDQVIV